MNTHAHSHPTLSRRLLGATSAIVAAGSLAWAAAAFASNNPEAKVKVHVDDKPIERVVEPELTASYSPVIKRVSPAVVKVLVTERAKAVPTGDMPPFFNDPMFRQFFGDQFGGGSGRRTLRQPPQEGLGSGVIVSADGYILTNNHVVNGADSIKVSLNDGRELTAKVVGTDPQTDLAVIKVDAKDLPAITFSDSDKVEVGDRVLAIGNPFGIGQTVTSGMVSALGRATLGLDYEDFIQTDAAINPGNSGGALVDVKGRLVGVNTAILSRSGGFQGIGFAIPANLARNVMEQLVSNGKVVRGFLGVSVQDLTPDLAKSFKLDEHGGALVAEVSADSPAAKGGLKSGDVITSLGGKPVTDARRLKLAVANIPPGTKVDAKVLREGEEKALQIEIGNQPRNRNVARNGGDFRGGWNDNDEGTLNGVGVADLDPQTRREFDVPGRVRGAIVTEVDPASAAAQAGLQPGDVIQEINRRPVTNAEDAVKLTENPASKKTLLRVWSQRGSRYVVVDETDSGSDQDRAS
ncbi:MAG TPA: DegQ family serine endoprotease [Opitutaceae bacterium]